MKLEEIENLVSIVREAKISELTVSTDGATVRLRKPLPATPAAKKQSAPAKAVAAKAAEPTAKEKPVPAGVFITAPMVGIFHSIDSVGAPGCAIRAGQTIGVIESMKLMNDIMADRDGVIAEVLIEDGMPVEYGQNLFRLEA